MASTEGPQHTSEHVNLLVRNDRIEPTRPSSTWTQVLFIAAGSMQQKQSNRRIRFRRGNEVMNEAQFLIAP